MWQNIKVLVTEMAIHLNMKCTPNITLFSCCCWWRFERETFLALIWLKTPLILLENFTTYYPCHKDLGFQMGIGSVLCWGGSDLCGKSSAHFLRRKKQNKLPSLGQEFHKSGGWNQKKFARFSINITFPTMDMKQFYLFFYFHPY